MMLWVALLALAVVTFATVFVAIYLADQLTRSKRHRVQGTPADLGLRYEDVQFLTADRLTLRGWYLDSPGARATIVLVHDLEATRADADLRLLQLQRDYVRRGFSVFAFDLRGHGESAGRRDSLGADERLDVRAAVAYVRRRTNGTQPVLVHGFGYGGALAIAAAGHNADVTGVIVDSPFLTMRSYVRQAWRHVPGPLFGLVTFFARRIFGGDIDALAPVNDIAQVTAPILLIHNEGDERVPVANTLNIAAASLDGRDQVWLLPDRVGHATAYRETPDLYLRRCLDFVDQITPARILTAQAAG